MAKAVIKVFCADLIEDDLSPIFRELVKKNKLKLGDYYTRFAETGYGGSAVVFIAENCMKMQIATLHKHVKFNDSFLGKYVRLNCLVFGNVKGFKRPPFFVVTDVSIRGSDNPQVQPIKPLQYIQALNDTAYSFFGNDENLFTKSKAAMLLDYKRTAYIKVEDGSVLSFQHKQRRLTSNGYVDLFIGDTGSIELSINRIVPNDNHRSYRFGHLTVKAKNINLSIDVFGEDEENDKFNGY